MFICNEIKLLNMSLNIHFHYDDFYKKGIFFFKLERNQEAIR